MKESAPVSCEQCILVCTMPNGSYPADVEDLGSGNPSISWEFSVMDGILNFETHTTIASHHL
jgi:hypothetical protein